MHDLAVQLSPTIKRPIIVVPLGSCEQHGPHLPVGTDTIIAEHLADTACANRSPTDVVIAPTIGVAASGEHADFAGTLSIGVDATATILIELIRSADWAGGVVIVNGHGGNNDAVRHALQVSHRDGRTRTAAWAPSVSLIDDVADGIGEPPDLHAGWVETSVMLHLRPDLVDMDAADVNAAEADSQPDFAVLRSIGVKAVSSSGVLGNPFLATAELGRVIVERWGKHLSAFVADRVREW